MNRASLLILARAGALVLALGVLVLSVGIACRSGPRARGSAPTPNDPPGYLEAMPATKAGPPFVPAPGQADVSEQPAPQQQAPPAPKGR